MPRLSRRSAKPPKHTRFKKGQSGNPRGRRPGRTSLKSAVIDELSQRIRVTENGRVRLLSMWDLIAKRMVTDAAKGNARARADLLKIFSKTDAASEAPAEEAHESAKDAEILARFREHLIAEIKGDK